MIRYGLLFLIGTLAVEAAPNVNSTLEEASSDRHSVTCPDHYVHIGDHCVRVDLSVSGTWEDMRAYCNLQDAELINLMDPQFFVDVSHHLRAIGTTGDFWIGATDVEQEGQWVWLDGSPVDMGTPYWSVYGCDNIQQPNGDTNQNCAQLAAEMHYYFNDKECTRSNHPICQLQ